MFVSDDSITVKPDNMGSGFQTSSHQLQGRSVQVLTGSPTLDHLLASLAAGGLAEDVVLEAVRLDGPQQDLGGARRGGEGRRRAGVGGAGRQRGVGAGRGGERRRPLIGQRALRERRRRRRGQRGRRIGRDDGRESEVVVVASLEEVVHALAAHHGFEGQGSLQALQLEDMEIRGGFYNPHSPLTRLFGSRANATEMHSECYLDWGNGIHIQILLIEFSWSS